MLKEKPNYLLNPSVYCKATQTHSTYMRSLIWYTMFCLHELKNYEVGEKKKGLCVSYFRVSAINVSSSASFPDGHCFMRLNDNVRYDFHFFSFSITLCLTKWTIIRESVFCCLLFVRNSKNIFESNILTTQSIDFYCCVAVLNKN